MHVWACVVALWFGFHVTVIEVHMLVVTAKGLLLLGQLHMFLKNITSNTVKIYAVFRLERAAEVLELTYLGKYFACVNTN